MPSNFSLPCTSYRTFISEDAGPSTLVATVRAKDPDGDGVLYLIAGGNEEGNFELDSQKGKKGFTTVISECKSLVYLQVTLRQRFRTTFKIPLLIFL